MKAMTSYHNKIYRYLSLVFSAGFLFFALSYLPVTVGTAAEADFSKNSTNTLSLEYEEDTGYFKILTPDGYVLLNSYPDRIEEEENIKKAEKNKIRSAFMLTVLDYQTQGEEDVYSTARSVNKDGFSSEPIQGGFRGTYDFPDYQITMTADVFLENDRLIVRVEPSKIKEQGTYHVLDITVLPGLFHLKTNPENYYVVPDGSGAVIRFDDSKAELPSYNQKLYGENLGLDKISEAYDVLPAGLPFFGMRNSAMTALGIISAGSADASLVSSPAEEGGYNSLYPVFSLRSRDKRIYEDTRADIDLYQKTPIYLEKLEITYLLEEKAGQNYADMAKLYRKYIMERYNLKKSNADTYPLYLDLYGATVKKKLFLGFPMNRQENLTTFKQGTQILDRLKEKQVDSAVVRYQNWSNDSIWGKPSKNPTPDGKLGGKQELLRLAEKAKKYQYQIYAGANLNMVYQGSTIFSRFYEFAKDMRKAPIQKASYKINTYVEDTDAPKGYFLTNAKKLTFVEKLAGNFGKQPFSGLAIIGNDLLYKDFTDAAPTMTQTYSTLGQTAAVLCKANIKIASDHVIDNMLEYSDCIFDAYSTSSNMFIETESIPFYQIALHGLIGYSLESVNSSPNPQEQYLRCVEYGASIFYEWIYEDASATRNSRNSDLFYANYSVWLDQCEEQYHSINNTLADTAGLLIESHEKLADGVYQTVYEDGSAVVVNYNTSTYISSFGEVPAKGFLRGKIS